MKKVRKGHKQSEISPPLMIRARDCEDEDEQPLQQYVPNLYATKEKYINQGRLVQNFIEEYNEGNLGYKLKLVTYNDNRLDLLASQMMYRIRQGNGEAHYRVGFQDDERPNGLGQEQMLENLKRICSLAVRVGAEVIVHKIGQGFKGLVAELVVRKIQRQVEKLDIRVLLLGDSGSGKSTLLSVLKSGERDNGNGCARIKVFTHRQQVRTGRTMRQSLHVIGLDSQGKAIGEQNMRFSQNQFDKSNKLLTFIDVGGHKKAQKQLITSICSFFPNYALWVVSGISKIPSSLDKLQISKLFQLRLIVVITHLDCLSKEQQLEVVLRIKEELQRFYPEKTSFMVREMEHIGLFQRITSQNIIPIFLVSNVTGQNLNLLTSFLNSLTTSHQLSDHQDQSTEFAIVDKYVVEGKLVLAGTVIKGTVKRGQILQIGPDIKGSFKEVEIISIYCLRIPVKMASCGQICTLAIHPLNYAHQWKQKSIAIRRGMVLVNSNSHRKAVHEFTVELTSYTKDKFKGEIANTYQPVINTLTTRQICIIVILPESQDIPETSMDKKDRFIDYTNEESKHISQKLKGKKQLKVGKIRFASGEMTLLRLRFKYYPQCITVGQKVIVNELKLVGQVKEIFQ